MCVKGSFDIRIVTVWILAFSQTMSVVSLFSFAPFYIEWILTNDKNYSHSITTHAINRYTGLLLCSAPAGIFISSWVWHWISDRCGRRGALLIGVGTNAFGTAFFGFIHSIAAAISINFILGLLNGNWTVMVTYLDELLLTKPKIAKEKTFAIFMLMYGAGTIIGPALGGFLAQPAQKYGGLQYELFIKYPFFLPYFSVGIISVFAWILVILFLEDPHPSDPFEAAIQMQMHPHRHPNAAVADAFLNSNDEEVIITTPIQIPPASRPYLVNSLSPLTPPGLVDDGSRSSILMDTTSEDRMERMSSGGSTTATSGGTRNVLRNLNTPYASREELQELQGGVRESVRVSTTVTDADERSFLSTPSDLPAQLHMRKRRASRAVNKSRQSTFQLRPTQSQFFLLIGSRNYLVALCLFSATTLLFSAFEALYPLWARLPLSQNGIQWNSSQIAIVFIVCAIVMTVDNLLIFPFLTRFFDPTQIIRYAFFLAFLVLFFLYPYWLDSGAINKNDVPSSRFMIPVILCNTLLSMAIGVLLTSLTLLMQIFVPIHPLRTTLPLANNLLQNVSTFVRSIGPLVGQALLSTGITLQSRYDPNYTDSYIHLHDLVFYVLAAIAFASFLLTYALPETHSHSERATLYADQSIILSSVIGVSPMPVATLTMTLTPAEDPNLIAQRTLDDSDTDTTAEDVDDRAPPLSSPPSPIRPPSHHLSVPLAGGGGRTRGEVDLQLLDSGGGGGGVDNSGVNSAPLTPEIMIQTPKREEIVMSADAQLRYAMDLDAKDSQLSQMIGRKKRKDIILGAAASSSASTTTATADDRGGNERTRLLYANTDHTTTSYGTDIEHL